MLLSSWALWALGCRLGAPGVWAPSVGTVKNGVHVDTRRRGWLVTSTRTKQACGRASPVSAGDPAASSGCSRGRHHRGSDLVLYQKHLRSSLETYGFRSCISRHSDALCARGGERGAGEGAPGEWCWGSRSHTLRSTGAVGFGSNGAGSCPASSVLVPWSRQVTSPSLSLVLWSFLFVGFCFV